MSRPSWDEYFLYLACSIALRSDDRFIKHGAVIVDNKTRHIIGTGYNNTLAGFSEDIIDLSNRDERRPYYIHAEENCILNSHTNPLSLAKGATLYCTGLPCVNCLQRIVAFGVRRIVITDRPATVQENEETAKIRSNILKAYNNLKIDTYDSKNKWVKAGLALLEIKQEEIPIKVINNDGIYRDVVFVDGAKLVKNKYTGTAWRKVNVDQHHDVVVFGPEDDYKSVSNLAKEGKLTVLHRP